MLRTINRVGLMRKLQFILFSLIGLVFIVFMFQAIGKANRTGGYDFTSYLLSAKALLAGENPYHVDTPFPYIYPLFLALLLTPLTFLPYQVANLLWFFLSVFGLGMSCLLIPRTIGPGALTASRPTGAPNSPPGLAVPLAIIIAMSPIQNNLLNGQVNAIVLLCCVLFLDKFMHGKWVGAGAWLGAAIALKLVPVVLIGFLLFRKQYRLVVASLAFALFFCLLPAVVAGTAITAYYWGYFRSFLLGGVSSLGAGSASGFNLLGLVTHYAPAVGHNPFLRTTSLALPVLLVIAADRQALRSRRSEAHLLAFSAYLLGALSLSPMGETHHLLLAIPAILIVIAYWFLEPRWRTTPVAALMIAFLLSFIILPRVLHAKPLHCVSITLLLVLVIMATRSLQPSTVRHTTGRSPANKAL